ncbi:hypothetical protein D1872_225650 [compost metagenome]
MNKCRGEEERKNESASTMDLKVGVYSRSRWFGYRAGGDLEISIYDGYGRRRSLFRSVSTVYSIGGDAAFTGGIPYRT